jgi:methionyl-tRNA formyltransferase
LSGVPQIWLNPAMRIVFMGSAEFACEPLKRLAKGEIGNVVVAVTQPDRPSGSGLAVLPCPTRECALALRIPTLTPGNVNDHASVEAIRSLDPDIIVVVAYGQILKPAILKIPPLGCVNIHGSLLPKYRGAAPIQWAIANGEQCTGVTAMFMNERMDAGDIILQRKIEIAPNDNAGTLHEKLAKESGLALVDALTTIAGNNPSRTPQVETEATYAPKLKKEDGRIEWTRPAEEIYNRIRAFNPWPTCFCHRKERPGAARARANALVLRVLRSAVEQGNGRPGEVLDVEGEGPLVAAGKSAVRLLEVQPVGKKVMSGAAFICGHDLQKGDMLI